MNTYFTYSYIEKQSAADDFENMGQCLRKATASGKELKHFSASSYNRSADKSIAGLNLNVAISNQF